MCSKNIPIFDLPVTPNELFFCFDITEQYRNNETGTK